jgi:pyruvate ferredoxin oxidoreductase gamma subunit
METIGRAIPNTPMLGALARLRPDVVSVEGCTVAVRATLGEKLSEDIMQKNFAAVQRAFEEVQSE